MPAEERVDKWLWAMRVFKTRTIATDACKKGRVSIGGATVKPSRTIKVGDTIEVRKPRLHIHSVSKLLQPTDSEQNSYLTIWRISRHKVSMICLK